MKTKAEIAAAVLDLMGHKDYTSAAANLKRYPHDAIYFNNIWAEIEQQEQHDRKDSSDDTLS